MDTDGNCSASHMEEAATALVGDPPSELVAGVLAELYHFVF